MTTTAVTVMSLAPPDCARQTHEGKEERGASQSKREEREASQSKGGEEPAAEP
eukprot:gene11329-2673_t